MLWVLKRIINTICENKILAKLPDLKYIANFDQISLNFSSNVKLSTQIEKIPLFGIFSP